MAIKRTTKVDPSFSMSSMADLIFLLLIFFLVTSTLVNPNALKLNLPKSSNQISAKATVSVSVRHHTEMDSFTFHINGSEKPVAFSSVEGELQNLLRDSDDPTFSIYSDKSVPVEQIVNLMNIGKRNHYKVILATNPE